MKTHIMLDLETLSTKPGGVILSIGAVKFDRHKVYDSVYISIDSKNAVKYGLTIDPDTVMWWMNQEDVARKFLTEPCGPEYSLPGALVYFTQWFSSPSAPDIELWGNGANFDNVLLAAAYDACGLDRPWKHYQDRCYRTFKAIHPEVKMQRTGTHHNALDDARCQAEHLISLPTFQAMCDREEGQP